MGINLVFHSFFEFKKYFQTSSHTLDIEHCLTIMSNNIILKIKFIHRRICQEKVINKVHYRVFVKKSKIDWHYANKNVKTLMCEVLYFSRGQKLEQKIGIAGAYA